MHILTWFCFRSQRKWRSFTTISQRGSSDVTWWRSIHSKLSLYDFQFQMLSCPKKINCSGHIHNQASMVSSSSQRGKREEREKGAKVAKRKTFPMIWADLDLFEQIFYCLSRSRFIWADLDLASFLFQRWRIRVKKGLSIAWPWRLEMSYLKQIINFDCSGHEIDETNIGNFSYSSGYIFCW